MTFSYRPSVPDDRGFIVSGWSSSLRMTRDVPLIAMTDWASVMHPQIERTLDRTGARTIVAHGAVLVGFICYEPNARIVDERRLAIVDYVFYVYVAQPFRKLGVAASLFKAAEIGPGSRFRYACRTLSSWTLSHKIPTAKYDPYYARYSPEETQRYERDRVR